MTILPKVSLLHKLSKFFGDYAATIYSMPPEEERRPGKIVTQVRTTRRAAHDEEEHDEHEHDEHEGGEYDEPDVEEEEEEEEKWVFLEDVRVILSYDAFSDYWIVGYYPISDIGIEVIARDPEVAVREFIDCMTRQWHFIVGDVDECIGELDKELSLFTRSVAEKKEILGWD